jgi:transcriptional regulator with PAS, ATPase and Fis domain
MKPAANEPYRSALAQAIEAANVERPFVEVNCGALPATLLVSTAV